MNNIIKTATISKHEDLSSQYWFRTKKDSKIFLSEGFRELALNFDCYKTGMFNSKVLELGNNGGSYQLNFNQKDLPKILKVLKQLNYTVKYRNDKTLTTITKKEYINQHIENALEKETVFIANILN